MEPLEMYDACTAALGSFLRDAGFSEVVIGLSGGMDSSLVAVMCHKQAQGSQRLSVALTW